MSEKTFEQQMQDLIDFTPKSVPYLIFKKTQNPKSEQFPRNEPEVVPFLFKLDGAQGTLLQVSIYERKGWPVVYSNIPQALIEREERILDIARHLESHRIYADIATDTDKGDVQSKLARKQAAKAEAKE